VIVSADGEDGPGVEPDTWEVPMDAEEARKRLLAERGEILQSLGETDEAAREDREAETLDDPKDSGDAAQPLAAEYEDDSIAETLRNRLAQVDRALRRVDDGTWGRSVRSGAPIPQARLDADPAAELTVEEAAQEERAAGR
jgi:DnaK suppressor protein